MLAVDIWREHSIIACNTSRIIILFHSVKSLVEIRSIVQMLQSAQNDTTSLLRPTVVQGCGEHVSHIQARHWDLHMVITESVPEYAYTSVGAVNCDVL